MLQLHRAQHMVTILSMLETAESKRYFDKSLWQITYMTQSYPPQSYMTNHCDVDSELSDNESSVSSIYSLATQPATPSPRCSTPICIDT